MDSIYIVSKNKSSEPSVNLINLLIITVKYKYFFSISNYLENVFFPSFKIESNIAHINEEGEKVNPTIWMLLFEKDKIYIHDNNFPIYYKEEEYFPIISFQCRESLFLLEFLIHVILGNNDYLVCNAENKIMTIEDLKKNFENKNYGWFYFSSNLK